MLDLVRLGLRRLTPPGGPDLLRQIGRLTDLDDHSEVLCAACGAGVALQYFVEEFGVNGSGVEADPTLVQRGDEWARGEEVAHRFHLQEGQADDLPYRDGIFDVAVGELGLTAVADPDTAVAELVRVTRPGGWIVLIQLVWKAPVDRERQDLLSGHLGVRPLMLVEWKRLLRGAGLVDILSEDWSDEGTAFRPRVAKPFPDFAELFSLSEKLGILRRAWGKWGWRGPVTALRRESKVHRLLTRERILGLDLLVARKPLEAGPESATVETTADAVTGSSPTARPEAHTPVLDAEPGSPSIAALEPESKSISDAEPRDGGDSTEVEDLPLFGGDS